MQCSPASAGAGDARPSRAGVGELNIARYGSLLFQDMDLVYIDDPHARLFFTHPYVRLRFTGSHTTASMKIVGKKSCLCGEKSEGSFWLLIICINSSML